MGNFTDEYLASLEKAVDQAREYFGGAISAPSMSMNPTEICEKGSGYASTLGNSRAFA